jgi:23S rRNA (uracil1939-C5)-methyltransferase
MPPGRTLGYIGTSACISTISCGARRMRRAHLRAAVGYHRVHRSRDTEGTRVPETLTLAIESLAFGGDAVAHAEDGRTVFVAGACPGDSVVAEVVEDRGRFLRARLVEVLEPSDERRTPPCPHFGECGGCQWQHVSHACQVDSKKRAVTDALRRIGGIEEPHVLDVVVAGQAYGYRNRTELTVDTDSRGGLVLGFVAAGTDHTVPIDRCMLMPERVRAHPRALAGALRFLSRGRSLDLLRVAVRSAANTSDVSVDLWADTGPFPRSAAARTLASAARFDTLTRVLVKGPVKARDVSGVEVLAGKGYLRERLAGFEYRVSAPSFFQVNTPVAERMVALVLEEIGASGDDVVLDVYAGVGTFTLPLASIANEVVAIESSGHAIRDLRANLETAGLDAEVAPGDAARALADVGDADLAVVDPPRGGLTPDALDALASCAPRRVVYVSCDPTTLARDAARLRAHGYALTRATPVDMFPQTFHVETVAVFDVERD